MAKAYCVVCGSVFEAASIVRSEDEKRHVQIRSLVCAACNGTTALHSDDFAPEVLALLARGPKTAAAVIEAYTAHLTGADDMPIDSALIERLRELKEQGLLFLLIAAFAAFVANSRADISGKIDLNQAIEQIFGWKAGSVEPEVNSGGAGDNHKPSDAPDAKRGPSKKIGKGTTHLPAPTPRKK